MTFKTLCSLQRRCDELSYSIHGKRLADLSETEILAHTCLHLGKLLGKIATVCESADHGGSQSRQPIKEEVVPDLVVYALQLANLYDIDLDATFADRINFVLCKHPDHCIDAASNGSLLADLRGLLAGAASLP